jgi:hypothetical protein
MPPANESQSLLKKTEDVVERLVQRLLRWPCNLVDTRYLLRCFQASAAGGSVQSQATNNLKSL